MQETIYHMSAQIMSRPQQFLAADCENKCTKIPHILSYRKPSKYNCWCFGNQCCLLWTNDFRSPLHVAMVKTVREKLAICLQCSTLRVILDVHTAKSGKTELKN